MGFDRIEVNEDRAQKNSRAAPKGDSATTRIESIGNGHPGMVVWTRLRHRKSWWREVKQKS